MIAGLGINLESAVKETKKGWKSKVILTGPSRMKVLSNFGQTFLPGARYVEYGGET